MGKAFTYVLRADAHPGQPSRKPLVGRMQAPGARSLVSAGDMDGIHQQDAVRLLPKAPIGGGKPRIEEPQEPVGTGKSAALPGLIGGGLRVDRPYVRMISLRHKSLLP